VFFALAVGGVATMFMRDRSLLQTSHVEKKWSKMAIGAWTKSCF
jgi:hypothetical protein